MPDGTYRTQAWRRLSFQDMQMMFEHVPDAPLAVGGGVDESALDARGRLGDKPLLDCHLHREALVRVDLQHRLESP